jgi:hypothetical protein
LVGLDLLELLLALVLVLVLLSSGGEGRSWGVSFDIADGSLSSFLVDFTLLDGEFEFWVSDSDAFSGSVGGTSYGLASVLEAEQVSGALDDGDVADSVSIARAVNWGELGAVSRQAAARVLDEIADFIRSINFVVVARSGLVLRLRFAVKGGISSAEVLDVLGLSVREVNSDLSLVELVSGISFVRDDFNATELSTNWGRRHKDTIGRTFRGIFKRIIVILELRSVCWCRKLLSKTYN